MQDLARFFALSADLFVISSLRERVLKRVNPAMCRLLGWSEEEFLSRSSMAFVHPDDVSRVDAILATIAAGQRFFPLEFRLCCKNGGSRWIEWRACYYPEEDRLYSVGRDVTARKEADAARAAAQTELTEVLESIADGFYSVDAEWRFTYVNAQAAKLLERSSELLLGRKLWSILPIDQEDRAPLYHLFQGTMEDRQARDLEIFAKLSRRWFSLRVYPRGDGGLSCFIQDITGRKQVEEALRASEAHFQAVANLGPDLLWRNDAHGGVIWSNEGWRTYTGHETQNRGYSLIHPADVERVKSILEAAFRDVQPISYETRIRRHDGVYRWFLMRVRPVIGSDGRTVDWFGAGADIDDLKHLQGQQLLLVAELQHRTRNLIAVVRSIARQTLTGAASPDDFAERFNKRLDALSRVQSFLSQGPATGLAELLQAELIAHGIEPKAPRVTLQGPHVELPPSSLQTLALGLHELTTNALKHGAFAEPSGSLSVQWSIENEAERPLLTVEWRERGVPMAPLNEPVRHGFGLDLIERALPYQLEATTQITFTPDGIACRVVLPVAVEGTGELVAL